MLNTFINDLFLSRHLMKNSYVCVCENISKRKHVMPIYTQKIKRGLPPDLLKQVGNMVGNVLSYSLCRANKNISS